MKKYTNEEINELVTASKHLVDKLTNNKNYTLKNKTRLTAVIVGSILKYGTDIIEPIKTILTNTPILISNLSVYEMKIQIKNYTEINSYLDGIIKGCVTTDLALSDDNNTPIYTIHNILVSTQEAKDESMVLERVTHEFNHLTTSVENEITINNEYEITVRNGLILQKINTKTLTNSTINRLFGEAINQSQSLDIMEIINILKAFDIDGENMRNYFNSINFKRGQSSVYKKEMTVISPLWKNKYFKDLCDYNIRTGNIQVIESDINSSLNSNNAYKKLCRSFDNIEYNNKAIQTASTLINVYNKKSKYKVLKKD